MIDLSTTYHGINLKNPLVVSASPLAEELKNLRRMEDSGAAAIVLPSLFEEQINIESRELDQFLQQGTESFAESLTYFPDLTGYNLGPEGYCEHVRRAKAAVGIPIIASLNGSSIGGWTEYAKKIQDAGADALELNIYYIPTSTDQTCEEVEKLYCDLVATVKSSLKIPVAVKIGAYFSSLAHMAKRLDACRGRRAGSVQPFLPARLRPRQPRSGAQPHAQHLARIAAAIELGGHSVRAYQGRPCRHRRRAHRRRCSESHDGRRARGGDDFGAASQRHRPSRHSPQRYARLDGRTRVQVHPPDARQHEPEIRRRPLRLPAR